MTPIRRFIIFLTIICSFTFPASVPAESSGTPATGASSGALGSEELMKGLMGILQQGIDEFIGTYEGRLGEVELLERLGNKIVLEVTYDNVKQSDNVYVQGEVRHFGEKLEGFKNTLTAVSKRKGKVRLTIGKTRADDEGWGISNDEVLSDQIRLYLVRDTNPDRPFGEIIYDLSKVWTDSDQPDQATAETESEGIELAEGEAVDDGETTGPASPSVFVKPGTVLKPYKPAVAGPIASAPPARAEAARVAPVQMILNHYDFYNKAKSAQWRSGAGPLPFPGQTNDKKGFARQIPKAALTTGNAAISLLQTHPQWIKNGWIQGVYPPITLKQDLNFKAIIGFLKGAVHSDGAVFQVHVKEGGKTYRAASRTLSANRYATLDVDLSRWTGKKIQIILQVIAGKTGTRDWAVWVKPRLAR